MGRAHPEIDAIFSAAIELDSTTDRAAYVASACAGDEQFGFAVGESDAWAGAPEAPTAGLSLSVNFTATRLQLLATNGATQILAARGSLAVAIESAPTHHGRHATETEDTSWSAADSSPAALDAFFAGLGNAAA